MLVFLTLTGALFGALMGVAIKLASSSFTTADIICFRGLVGMAFMWGVARAEGVALRTSKPRMHAWRGFVGTVSVAAWFYALAYLPLATANALFYMNSIWIVVFVIAERVLSTRRQPEAQHERIQASHVATVVAGFAGMLLLFRPDMPKDELFAGMVGMVSGLMSGLGYMQIGALGKAGEPATRTVLYFSVVNAVIGAAWMPFAGSAAGSWSAAPWLVLVGVFASLTQWCMARAYAKSPNAASTLMIANLQYSGLLFSALLGIVVFAEDIPLLGWLGIATIICSGIAATAIRMRAVSAGP
jgi:drug/metabolite transporter (DMT)-like permease